MKTYEFDNVLQANNTIDIERAKWIGIIILPVFIGLILDRLITNILNPVSCLLTCVEFTVFVYIGIALTFLMIYKKLKKGKSSPNKKRKYREGLKRIFQSNSNFYTKEIDNDKEFLRPAGVDIQEDENDLLVHFYMPLGISKEVFKKNKELFENLFGYSVLRTTEDIDRLTFYFRKQEIELSTDYLYQKQEKVILGYDTQSEPVLWEPLQEPHLIVAAGTGGGKTIFLQSIVLQLKNITNNLIFGDLKMNEFGPLAKQGYTVHTTLQDVVDAIEQFYNQMTQTALKPAENGVRDYTKLGLEPNYFIIDEYSQLISLFPNDKEGKIQRANFERHLGSIARLGRSNGYYVILSMQQPNANTLSTEIRDNMMKKVAIRGANSTIQTMIFGERVNDIQANLDYGNHIVNTGAGYEVIKVPYYEGDFFKDMA